MSASYFVGYVDWKNSDFCTNGTAVQVISRIMPFDTIFRAHNRKQVNMIFREATIEDIEGICRLLSVLFEQESEFSPDFESQLKGVRELLSNPQMGRSYVMEDSGRIVGVVNLLFLVSTALGGKVAMLEDLVLEKDWRGMGLGTQLLDYAIRAAIEHDCKRITLLTDKHNLAAQSFYEKMGFKHSTMIPMRLVF